VKDYKKDSHSLNISFGVNPSPTFSFYNTNSYMRLHNSIEKYIDKKNCESVKKKKIKKLKKKKKKRNIQ